ncbi:MAG: hypothetical protein ACMUIU_01530 [bacterium]
MKKNIIESLWRIRFSLSFVITILMIALWTGLIVLSPFIAKVNAQTICIPYAGGVPYLSGPPNWWNNTLMPPQYHPYIHGISIGKEDDPRWEGSLSITYQTHQVVFRALHYTGTNSLYLSWYVQVDPSLDNQFDKMWVGFRPDSGLDEPVAIEIVPYTGPINKEAEPPSIIEVYEKDSIAGPTVWNLQSAPTWLGDTKVWVKIDPPYKWAINMRVQIDNAGLPTGINLGTSFGMWYQVNVATPGGIITYKWPQAIADLTATPPDPAGWGDVLLGAVGDPACVGGVSLASLDIGTRNLDSHEIKITQPNTFFAEPLNNTGLQIPANWIKAKFRIANWGSVPATTDPDQLWTTISGPCVGGGGSGGLCDNNAPIPNGTKGVIEMTWSLNNCEQWEFMPATEPCPQGCVCDPAKKKRRHQCMLVELSSEQNVIFTNSSVYRNMDFVDASEFSRDADISIKGLIPIPGGGDTRDVYLYVETENMPKSMREGKGTYGFPPIVAQYGTGYSSGQYGSTNWGLYQGGGNYQYGLRGSPSNNNIYAYNAALRRAANMDFLNEEDTEVENMPKYVVHVYHDTGEKVLINGAEHSVLTPQIPFGYYVRHEGEILGWKHSLTGADGAVLTEIAPNFYKIAIENDGVAVVTTSIEAVESRPPAITYGTNCYSYNTSYYNTYYISNLLITRNFPSIFPIYSSYYYGYPTVNYFCYPIACNVYKAYTFCPNSCCLFMDKMLFNFFY